MSSLIRFLMLLAYRKRLLRGVIERIMAKIPSRVAKQINFYVTSKPKTFNEHLRYRMVRDLNSLDRVFADKLACKDYVSSTLETSDFLPDTIRVFEDCSALLDFDFPDEFVLKANHLSGGSVMCWNGEKVEKDWSMGPYSRNLLNSQDLDLNELFQFFKGTLEARNSRYLYPEVSYNYAKPSIILEALFTDGIDRSLPKDLKLFMFKGELKLIRYHSFAGKDNFSKSIDEFSPTWQHLPNTFFEPSKVFRNSLVIPQKPNNFPEILEKARTLSFGLDFVRVDFLVTSQAFKIGEITSFPTAGLGRWKNSKIDHELGAFFK